ncbi:hypothetical protein EVJ58_g3232 [Rhodofomes roseus]|uniref:CBS domain containing-hemolysin-like protein n=1 Tax=Rhodofomes roseus TaxID=34475 RepID=A0A4Y9YM23_9APHY|nr:hypothetical protein EVJ58_g3232 [Rhodofomes roseus]
MRLSHSLLSFAALAFTLAHASPTTQLPTDEEGEPPGSSAFWYKLIGSVGLVLLGGVFAGWATQTPIHPPDNSLALLRLTLGLMGLDELHLRVLSASSDDPVERKNAQKVLSLLTHRRHWVLVVLLLGNVIVNETLPIFLDSALGGGLAAVAISTTMIVIFGEIIPQAASVRYGLSIGASCAPVVLGMMYLFAPVAYPIAKLLDWILGANDTHTYKKAELKSFLAFHRQGEEPLRDDEISILNGVLELNNKHVEELMTPMQDVVTISSDRILDHDTVDFIQTGRAHLLLLSTMPGKEGGAIGVVTLEDIIEEIISEEIIDETDRYEDNHSKRRARRQFNAQAMRGIIENRGRTSRANSQTTVPTAGERTPLIAAAAGVHVVEHDPQDGAEQRLLEGTIARDFVVSPRPANGGGPQYGSVIVGSPSNADRTTEQ